MVEDDAGIREPLVRALAREGYDVEAVADGAAAVREALAGAPDLLLLDLGLPGLDGLEVCRLVRRERRRLPILVLTARDEELDLVQGLDAGADDYVTKPFRLAELLARVRALLRRGTEPAEGVIEVGELRIDLASHRAARGDRELELTPKEFGLLAFLAAHSGQALRRERIMREVWDQNWFGSTKTLDVHVSSLRRKLGDDATDPELLLTVRGIGFRLEAG